MVKEDINKVNKFIITKLKSDVPLIPIISEHLLKSGENVLDQPYFIIFQIVRLSFWKRHRTCVLLNLFIWHQFYMMMWLTKAN